jgi:ribokinase
MSVIVLLGDINIDLVLDIPEYPAEGGEAIATGQRHMLGGSATNTAIALARSGHECRLIGRVGHDAWGNQALADLDSAGIDTGWIGRDPYEPTQTNIVTASNGGERTMFAYRGANAQLSARAVTDDAFADAALFHLSGYALLQNPQAEAAYRAVELASDCNIPVTIDIPGGVVDALAPLVRKLLPKLDTIMLGGSDLATLSGVHGRPLGDCVKALLDLGVKRIAVKSGGDGSSLYHAGGTASAPWFSVEVIDTTGAGDAFAAGHIHGRLTGLAGNDSCRLANAFGALAVTRQGAGQVMPTLDEAATLLPDKAKAALC